LGIVAYGVVILTEPEQVPTKPKTRTASGSAPKAPEGFAEEDMNAQYARYTGAGRDAFAPLIKPTQRVVPGEALGTGGSVGVTSGGWSLTGISVINGERSALIENPSQDGVIFLKVGEVWNGMRVTAIEPKAVILVNSQGQQTRLGFVETIEEDAAANAVSNTATRTASGGASMNTSGNLAVGGVAPSTPPLTIPTGRAGGQRTNEP
jgi:hypothetical protein